MKGEPMKRCNPRLSLILLCALMVSTGCLADVAPGTGESGMGAQPKLQMQNVDYAASKISSWKEMSGPGVPFLSPSVLWSVADQKADLRKRIASAEKSTPYIRVTYAKVAGAFNSFTTAGAVDITNKLNDEIINQGGKGLSLTDPNWVQKFSGKTQASALIGTGRLVKIRWKDYGGTEKEIIVKEGRSGEADQKLLLEPQDVSKHPAEPYKQRLANLNAANVDPMFSFLTNPKIVVSDDGKILYLSGISGLFKGAFDGNNVNWQKVPGSLTYIDIALLGDNLWVCRYPAGFIGVFNPDKGDDGIQLDGGIAVRISCNTAENVSVHANSTMYLYQRNDISLNVPTGKSWTMMRGQLHEIAVAPNGFIWGLWKGFEPAIVFRKNGKWITVGGSLSKISVSPNGFVCGIDADGFIFYRDGITKDTPEGSSWIKVDGPKLVAITAATNGVWGIDVNGKIYLNEQLETAEFIATGKEVLEMPLNLPEGFRGEPSDKIVIRSVSTCCNADGSPVAYAVSEDDTLFKFDTKSFDLDALVYFSDDKFDVVSGSQKGDLIGLKNDGYIAMYDVAKSKWVNIEPKLKNVRDVAISDVDIRGSRVFAIAGKSTDRYLYFYNENTKAWNTIDGTKGVVCISIGKDGAFFAINNDGVIVKYDSAKNGWDDISDPSVAKFINIAVGSVDKIVAIDTHYEIWNLDPKIGKFVHMPGKEGNQAGGVVECGINAGGWMCFVTGDGKLFYDEIKGISVTAQPVLVVGSRTEAQDSGAIAKKDPKGKSRINLGRKTRSGRAAAAVVGKGEAAKKSSKRKVAEKPVVSGAKQLTSKRGRTGDVGGEKKAKKRKKD